jgi:hypothetical protein
LMQVSLDNFCNLADQHHKPGKFSACSTHSVTAGGT